MLFIMFMVSLKCWFFISIVSPIFDLSFLYEMLVLYLHIVSINLDLSFIVFSLCHQELFRTGNVIQLVSRSSGKAVQVVVAPSGQLVVDALGPEGPQVYHGQYKVKIF
jgi:hypothetical protein